MLHTNKMEGPILPIEPSIFTYLAAIVLFFCRGQHSPASAGNPLKYVTHKNGFSTKLLH
jgi:hypothetical protein